MRKKNNIFALGIYSILKKTENVFHLMIILAISFTLLSIGVIYTRYIDFAYNNTLKEYEEDVMLFADVPDNYDSGEIQKINEQPEQQSTQQNTISQPNEEVSNPNQNDNSNQSSSPSPMEEID